MAKSRVWKPKADERIDWNHPYIQFTKQAPGYLVQELFGYADTTWEKWLGKNRALWIEKNRRPWVLLDMLGRANSEDVTNGKEDYCGGGGD